MKRQTEYLGVDVAFSLPNWFPPARFNYPTYEEYYPGHPYYGQKHYKGLENSATNRVLKMNHAKEIATDQLCGHLAIFHLEDIAPDKLLIEIANIEKRLNTFLARFKEAKEPLK